MAFDGVKQQRRTFRQAGRDFRDAADFAYRVGALDPAQRAEPLHLIDELAQIRVKAPGHLFPLSQVAARLSLPCHGTAVHMVVFRPRKRLA